MYFFMAELRCLHWSLIFQGIKVTHGLVCEWPQAYISSHHLNLTN